MNIYVRFRTPGAYTCTASAAEITTAFRDEEIRPALLVKSNPISLTIVNDPGWSHSAAIVYEGAFDKFCRGKDVVEHRFLQCSDIARRITYLDTSNSLAMEVKVFDGRDHGWDTGFWEAIQHSSNPQEALRLMTSRMQEADFQVPTDVLDWLASSQLRMEIPDAFQGGELATYHDQAVEALRSIVRLLGNSLSKKNSDVLAASMKTYRTFAESTYCEREPLISREERDQVSSGVDALR